MKGHQAYRMIIALLWYLLTLYIYIKDNFPTNEDSSLGGLVVKSMLANEFSQLNFMIALAPCSIHGPSIFFCSQSFHKNSIFMLLLWSFPSFLGDIWMQSRTSNTRRAKPVILPKITTPLKIL
jgi:hypothetical protein